MDGRPGFGGKRTCGDGGERLQDTAEQGGGSEEKMWQGAGRREFAGACPCFNLRFEGKRGRGQQMPGGVSRCREEEGGARCPH